MPNKTAKTDSRDSDRNYLLNPIQWPYWPYQTIKRRNGNRSDVATLFENEGKYKFAEINFFSLVHGDGIEPQWKNTTVDEILNAGWIVD